VFSEYLSLYSGCHWEWSKANPLHNNLPSSWSVNALVNSSTTFPSPMIRETLIVILLNKQGCGEKNAILYPLHRCPLRISVAEPSILITSPFLSVKYSEIRPSIRLRLAFSRCHSPLQKLIDARNCNESICCVISDFFTFRENDGHSHLEIYNVNDMLPNIFLQTPSKNRVLICFKIFAFIFLLSMGMVCRRDIEQRLGNDNVIE